MAKRKPKEPLKVCVYCGTDKQTRWEMDGTYMHREVANFTKRTKGIDVCGACAKVIDDDAKTRAKNIRRLKDLPITSPQWGKFLDSRKS